MFNTEDEILCRLQEKNLEMAVMVPEKPSDLLSLRRRLYRCNPPRRLYSVGR